MNWQTFLKEFGFPVALAVYLIAQQQVMQSQQSAEMRQLQTEVRTELKELLVKAMLVIEKNTDVLRDLQTNHDHLAKGMP